MQKNQVSYIIGGIDLATMAFTVYKAIPPFINRIGWARNFTIFDHWVSGKVSVDIYPLCHKCQHALATWVIKRFIMFYEKESNYEYQNE